MVYAAAAQIICIICPSHRQYNGVHYVPLCIIGIVSTDDSRQDNPLIIFAMDMTCVLSLIISMPTKLQQERSLSTERIILYIDQKSYRDATVKMPLYYTPKNFVINNYQLQIDAKQETDRF